MPPKSLRIYSSFKLFPTIKRRRLVLEQWWEKYECGVVERRNPIEPLHPSRRQILTIPLVQTSIWQGLMLCRECKKLLEQEVGLSWKEKIKSQVSLCGHTLQFQKDGVSLLLHCVVVDSLFVLYQNTLNRIYKTFEKKLKDDKHWKIVIVATIMLCSAWLALLLVVLTLLFTSWQRGETGGGWKQHRESYKCVRLFKVGQSSLTWFGWLFLLLCS